MFMYFQNDQFFSDYFDILIWSSLFPSFSLSLHTIFHSSKHWNEILKIYWSKFQFMIDLNENCVDDFICHIHQNMLKKKTTSFMWHTLFFVIDLYEFILYSLKWKPGIFTWEKHHSSSTVLNNVITYSYIFL